MKITEKDIFNFVYYPAKLEKETADYISANMKLFEEKIILCGNLRKNLTENLNATFNVITLSKRPSVETSNKPVYFIAADSINLDKSVKTETYVNKENRIFAKAIFYKDRTRVFVFSEDDNDVRDFKIVLKPSELSFKIDSLNDPIELPAGLEIESINIERK